MEEQIDFNFSIYSGTTNDDIIASSGDEWDNSIPHIISMHVIQE